MKNKIWFCLLIIWLFSASLLAQNATRVKFAKGKSAATVSGTIGKMKSKCFVLSTREGQQISAYVKSKSGKVQFPLYFGASPYKGGTSYEWVTNDGDSEVCIENLSKISTTFTITISVR
jgi:hypothetical protein